MFIHTGCETKLLVMWCVLFMSTDRKEKHKENKNWKNHEKSKGQLKEDLQMKYLMYAFHILPRNSVILH